MRLIRARFLNFEPSGQLPPPPRSYASPGGVSSPQPGSRASAAYAPGMPMAQRPARARFAPPNEGAVPAAGPPMARFIQAPEGGRPTLPSAREPDGDRPFASLIQRLATDQGFREAIRQEIQAFRQRRQQGNAEVAGLEDLETSWMGDGLSDPFGEEPLEADGQAVPAVGPGEAVFELADDYGPLAQMSPHLRIQAAKGYRAGVIRLKNGMFLVTEIPETALEPEFGVIAMLAPLAISVATKALENPETQKALVHATEKGVQATGKGIKAVGKGVKHLVHPGHHRPGRHHAPHRPPAHSGPAAHRVPVSPQGYVMVPQGAYYQPAPQGGPMPTYPGGQPMLAYPGGHPMPAYPGGQQMALPGRGYPQLPPAGGQAAAVPWASPEDFQGLIEDSSWPAGW